MNNNKMNNNKNKNNNDGDGENNNNNNNNNNRTPPPFNPRPLQILPPPPPPQNLLDTTLTLATYKNSPGEASSSTTLPPSSSGHRRKRSKVILVVDDHQNQNPNPNPNVVEQPSPRTPVRRPDPNAPEITDPCSECGRRFWSWKALFGHMRCHPERAWRGIRPPPHLRRDNQPPLRILGPPPPPTETAFPTSTDHEVANSLLFMAAGASVDGSTSARFECSGCKKTFPTHQALGGHRASHKNHKVCYAKGSCDENISLVIMEGDGGHFFISNRTTIHDEMGLNLSLTLGSGLNSGLSLGQGHKCVVCCRVFPSGQALGGHMRCHWERTEEGSMLSLGPVPSNSNAPQPMDAQSCIGPSPGPSRSNPPPQPMDVPGPSQRNIPHQMGAQLPVDTRPHIGPGPHRIQAQKPMDSRSYRGPGPPQRNVRPRMETHQPVDARREAQRPVEGRRGGGEGKEEGESSNCSPPNTDLRLGFK